MKNLETLKRSVKSAEDLAGVVRTMKTMAAVSIRQYETASHSLSSYARTIEIGLAMLLRSPNQQEEFAKPNPAVPDTTGAIVFGSDQGMCGQFNEQIVDFTVEYLHAHVKAAAPVMCVGHRVADKLTDAQFQTAQAFSLPGSATGITFLVHDLLPAIDSWRTRHEIGEILVFHNRRLSASSWQPFVMQLLPLRPNRLRHSGDANDAGRSLPFWTMDTSVLFSRLVKQFLFVSLFRACAESLAGENASRIAAMQSAERNITERLHRLRSEYAQQRQTAITEELLDVVTGFEALKQDEENEHDDQRQSTSS